MENRDIEKYLESIIEELRFQRRLISNLNEKIIGLTIQKIDHREIININEVQDFTGLSASSIRCYVSKGMIPVYKRGKPLLFKRSAILDWINKKGEI